MIYFMIIIATVLSSFSTVCQKDYASRTSNVRTALNLYMLIVHPLAAVYYLCLSKGTVPVNGITLLYSLLFALVCIASVVLSMLSYSRISLVYISVFGGAGGVIIPFLFETIFHGETFSVFQLISVIMRLIAVLVPLFMAKGKSNELQSSMLLCILLFINGGAANLIPKLFAAHPDALNTNTFCFWTNVVVIPVISVYVIKKDGIKNLYSDIKKLKGGSLACIFIGTALSNAGSLIKYHSMKFVSATVNSILSSSLGMVLTVLISRFLYKEKISKQMLVCVVFSMLAVTFSVLG